MADIMPALSSRNMLINDIIDRVKLPFRKEKELYCSLEKITGFLPHNIELYKQALMHKSLALRSENGKFINNERLEFLGDAILGAIVGDIVYKHFDGKREGFLTNTRSKIVQRETLNRLANEIGLSQLIISNGHASTHNSYMEGNAFEALLGALYLDKGYFSCKLFMQKKILSHIINIDKVAYKEVNFKSKLIEWCQKNKVSLDFELVEEKRDDNNSPVFTYQAIIEGQLGEKGTGYSKKESQQQASKLTLQNLRRKPQFMDSIFLAKTQRTKMEEQPIESVPDIDSKVDFIINTEKEIDVLTKESNKKETSENIKRVDDEINSSNEIKVKTTKKSLSKEDIIAAAEVAAFSEEA